MTTSLLIGRRTAGQPDLAAMMHGLGLQVITSDGASIPLPDSAASYVVVLADDALNVLAEPLLTIVARASICIAVTSTGFAGLPAMHASLAWPVSEGSLLNALLEAGYELPDGAECAGITATLHDLVDGDQAVVAELLESLIDTGVADLAAYQRCCAQGQWAAAGSLAHRIKGTARMAGSISVAQVCERMESAARNDGAATVLLLNALFIPSVRRLCDALSALRR